MADEPVNAGGGAAAADAGAAPAAVDTGAGAVSTESAAAAAPVVVEPSETESTASFFTRAAETRKKAETVVDPAKKVEEPTLDEKQLAEKAEADRVAAEKKVADDAAAKEAADKGKEAPTEDEEEFDLTPIGPLPPRELAAKLKENPELAAAIDKSGLKDQLFAASRLASRVAGYEEIFPDVEVAKYAAKAAEDFGQLGQKFVAITDVKSTAGFLTAMMPFSYQLDENGEPLIDEATKQPISDGSVGKFVDNVFGLALDAQEKIARESNDEDTLAAIELLKARTGRGPASAAQEDMTDAQKKEAERLKAERESLQREKSQGVERKAQEFELNVQKDIDGNIGKLVDGILDKVELSDFDRKVVQKEIIATLEERVAARPEFFTQMDALMRRPLTEKVRQDRVALAMRTVKALIKPVAQEKLTAAGAKMKARLDQKVSTQAAREQASRSDLRGAARPAQPQSVPTDAELQAEVFKEYGAKHNGDEPSTSEMFTLMAAKRKQYAAR